MCLQPFICITSGVIQLNWYKSVMYMKAALCSLERECLHRLAYIDFVPRL